MPGSTSDIGEFVRTIAVGDVPKAIAFDGRLQFQSEYRRLYSIWSFFIAFANPTDVDATFYGRRWRILWGKTKEVVPKQDWNERRFAPAIVGGRLTIRAHSHSLFQSAIVTDSLDPPSMSGDIALYSGPLHWPSSIEIPSFDFSVNSGAAVDAGANRLNQNDAKLLIVSLEKYHFAQRCYNSAIFRADRVLGLSREGVRIVNRFIIDEFRRNTEKERTISFDPILPCSYKGITLQTTDHYLSPKLEDFDVFAPGAGDKSSRLENDYLFYVFVYNFLEVNKRIPADASLVLELARLRTRFSFDDVQKELLRTASSEERARVEGMLAAGMLEAAGLPSTPRRLSETDFAELREFLSANPWKKTDGLTPSAFIRQRCEKWLPLGLALADIRAAQPALAMGYTNETHHDPSKKIEELYVRPHKLPAGMPPPRLKVSLRAADLSEAELHEKRERWKAEGTRRRRQALPKNRLS